MLAPSRRFSWLGLAPFAFVFAALVAGCGSDSTKPDEDGPKGKVTVNVEHAVDGDPLVFDEIRYTNAAGNQYSVITLKYFVSDVTFLGAQGESTASEDARFINARDPVKRAFIVDRVPVGEYTTLRLTFGLDENLNVSGALPSTTDNLNMEWPPTLGGGYHYMQLEGHYIRQDLSTGSFNVHTGKFGHAHYITMDLSLPAPMNIADDGWKIRLSMNVNEWFAHPDIYDFDDFGPSIMEDMDAQHLLRDNGADVFSVVEVEKQ